MSSMPFVQAVLLYDQVHTLQVMELTQGQRVEVEILAVLVQQIQKRRQEHGMHGSDTPGNSPKLLHALPP